MNHSRGTSTGVYVEIKSPAEHHKQGLDLSKAVIADLEAAGYLTQQKPVYLQCFDQAEVRRIRVDLKCQLPLIQLLSKTPTAKEIAEIARVADGVGVPIDAVITGTEISEGVVEPQVSSLVRLAHDNALLVHVWTFRLDALPNFTDDGNLLLGWLVRDGGVDGIFADQPDAVLKWRGKTQTANRRPGTFHLLNSPSRKSTVPNGRPGQ
jgi:glycerophosphoryl diester phosphodiesterase